MRDIFVRPANVSNNNDPAIPSAPPEEGREMPSFYTMAGSLVALILIVSIGWGLTGFFSNNSYKAVFLNNNQVYFGKVAFSLSPYFITLKDVYYVRVDQAQQGLSQQAQPNLLLAKLGLTELYKPMSTMKINKSAIWYMEDLQLDSPIIAAINKIKESLANDAKAPTNQQQSASVQQQVQSQPPAQNQPAPSNTTTTKTKNKNP